VITILLHGWKWHDVFSPSVSMDEAYTKIKTKPMCIPHSITANVWYKFRECRTWMGWHFPHEPLKLKKYNTRKRKFIRNCLTVIKLLKRHVLW